MTLNITIIGFGIVGRQIASLLMTEQRAALTINVLEVSDEIDGTYLDFFHAFQLCSPHQLKINNRELFHNADFIFHCAGGNVPEGADRLAICDTSIAITEQVFSTFKPMHEPKVIVVANPVEIITHITACITGLPPHCVMGTGTLLDSIRMNDVIEREYASQGKSDVFLLGEHGAAIFLSKQLSTVGNQAVETVLNGGAIDTVLEKVKKAAAAIKLTQGATQYGVSFCAFELFKAVAYNKTITVPVSTQVPDHIKNLVNLPSICLSLPTIVSAKGALPDLNYRPDENDQEGLRKATKQLLAYIPKLYLPQ